MAATVAAEILNVSPAKAFSINCAELQHYLGDGDIVQVTCNGDAISLPGLGSAAMVYCGKPSRFDLLQNLVFKLEVHKIKGTYGIIDYESIEDLAENYTLFFTKLTYSF